MFALLWVQTAQGGDLNAIPEFGPHTVLVYQNTAADQERQFVVRIARFLPDRVMEWESESHQGTVHLSRKAVQSARKLTLSGLFDPGVDTESSDTLIKWLSRDVFEELARKGQVKVVLNAFPLVLQLKGRSTARLSVDRTEVEIPVLELEDSRKGRWLFLDHADNPLLVEHSNPYYRERLTAVSTTQKNSLRWIKKLPPVH